MAVVAQLKDCFEQLLIHYKSDMERLRYISEGDFFLAQLGAPHCPFCGEHLEEHSAKKLQEDAAKCSIQAVSAEEARKIAANVRDLEKTLATLDGEESQLGTEVVERERVFSGEIGVESQWCRPEQLSRRSIKCFEGGRHVVRYSVCFASK